MTDLVGYLGYRSLAAGIGALSLDRARSWGERIARRLAKPGSTRFDLAKRHLTRAVGDVPEIDALVVDMFGSYGRYWAEVFWFKAGRAEEMFADSETIGVERIYQAIEAGNGMVFAVAHLGNWDAAGIVAHQIGARPLAVAEDLPNRRLTEWFLERRRAMGIEVVVADGSRDTVARLIAHLKAGGALALPSDRDVTGRGLPVEFFGEETTMPPGPIALADRTGAVVLPVGTYFTDAGYRNIVHEPLALEAEGDRQDRVAAGMERLAEVFEVMIRLEPTQWHLFQPNWPSDRIWLESRR